MHNDTTVYSNTKVGTITTKSTRKGIEFRSQSFERGAPVFIGTLSGVVFEKVSSIYRKLDAFNEIEAELTTIKDAGAQFLRIVLPDKSATYSISISDFELHAERVFVPPYGWQLVDCMISKST